MTAHKHNKFIIAVAIAFTVWAIIWATATAGAYLFLGMTTLETTIPAPKNQPCLEVSKGRYNCTDKETLIKWMEHEKDNVELHQSSPREIVARITKYSRADSCHNRHGNECLTAIGRDTVGNHTVACPRDIGLGTRIRIGGFIYTCEDRYAKWVHERYGNTFDIFTESYDEAVQFGVRYERVAILPE